MVRTENRIALLQEQLGTPTGRLAAPALLLSPPDPLAEDAAFLAAPPFAAAAAALEQHALSEPVEVCGARCHVLQHLPISPFSAASFTRLFRALTPSVLLHEGITHADGPQWSLAPEIAAAGLNRALSLRARLVAASGSVSHAMASGATPPPEVVADIVNTHGETTPLTPAPTLSPQSAWFYATGILWNSAAHTAATAVGPVAVSSFDTSEAFAVLSGAAGAAESVVASATVAADNAAAAAASPVEREILSTATERFSAMTSWGFPPLALGPPALPLALLLSFLRCPLDVPPASLVAPYAELHAAIQRRGVILGAALRRHFESRVVPRGAVALVVVDRLYGDIVRSALAAATAPAPRMASTLLAPRGRVQRIAAQGRPMWAGACAMRSFMAGTSSSPLPPT